MAALENTIKVLYARVPPSARPTLKKAFVWSSLRVQAATTARSVNRGKKVQFLGFEIAYLDDYEFLSPGSGEVMVEGLASCVSPGTESAVLMGLPGARRTFPYSPGYSMVGRVQKVGKGVSGIKEGDIVAGRMSHASHGLMTTKSLFKVPAGVSVEQAAFIELGIITLQGIRKAGIRPGDHVAVIGQGLIGQMAVRLARLVGAEPLIAVASSKRRAAPALLPGGADSFLSLKESPDQVRALNADVVIEAVGSSKAIELAMEATRVGGTVALLGSSRDLGRDLDWHRLAQQRQLNLVGAHISAMPGADSSPGRWTYKQEGELFLDLLASGRLDVSGLITWRPRPEECNKVYEVLAEGGRDQVAIVFQWAESTAQTGTTAVAAGGSR